MHALFLASKIKLACPSFPRLLDMDGGMEISFFYDDDSTLQHLHPLLFYSIMMLGGCG